jgi:hypothetical protein
MRYTLVEVERFPKAPEQGKLYWSKEFEISGHLCACGCGDFIQLPITPVDFRISIGANGPTLRPSVGNWNVCDAHYYITNGEVQWLPRMTSAQIAAGREYEDARRASYYQSTRRSLTGVLFDNLRRILKFFGWR